VSREPKSRTLTYVTVSQGWGTRGGGLVKKMGARELWLSSLHLIARKFLGGLGA